MPLIIAKSPLFRINPGGVGHARRQIFGLGPAAIDNNRLPVDHFRTRRTQESDHRCRIGRFGQARIGGGFDIDPLERLVLEAVRDHFGAGDAVLEGAFDVDLELVAAVEGGMSRNRAAKQFGVAISTAIGWMKRVDETGSVAPGQMGGHKPKAVSGDDAVWLSQRIKDGDFTIRGLVAELAGRGLKVDYHSVWDFVHAEKFSFKKKRGGWRTRSSRRRMTADAMDKVSKSRRA